MHVDVVIIRLVVCSRHPSNQSNSIISVPFATRVIKGKRCEERE